MNEYAQLWLNRQISEKPTARVICFPHAGGSSSFFGTWGRLLPTLEICSVRYPGRAERIEEPQPVDLRVIARDIAKALESLMELPLILFGHSLGAAVALETARSLEESGLNVTHLFASGSRNGPLPHKREYIEESDENLCKHLIEMGGTDPNAINDSIFLELVLPGIRADGKMFNAYDMKSEPKLKCSVTTIYGDVDSHADIRPWQEITTAEFNEICVPGDHFYLSSNPPGNIIMNTAKRLLISKSEAA